MDRLIYIAMSGAEHAFNRQAVTAHNLANASTTGYRAEVSAFRALPVFGEGHPTRAFVVDSTVGSNFRPGAIHQTGRDLDVAIQGRGWIAVRAPDGTEAYTRNGSLKISPNGLLQTRDGMNVVGGAGPIAVPPDAAITIAHDGTISTIPAGQQPNTIAVVGRIKLVNPPEGQLVRGDDGLFRLKDGGAAPADVNVGLLQGALEASNVNPVTALVGMIEQARQYDMEVQLLRTAQNNAQQASRIMSLT